MRIVPYDKKYKNDFIEMNKKWITEMFVLEEQDVKVLNDFEKYVENGGQIYFALDDFGQVLACCMIVQISEGEWEIEKFCAKGLYTGTGAGTACLKACIDYAKTKSAKRIVIVSNKKCTHAVKLYFKHGFKEIPVDKQKFPFNRADIAFELVLD